MITEARKGDWIFAPGYPMGCSLNNDLLDLLDVTHGTVLHNSPNSTRFTFRIEDGYLDAGNRTYEMQGFSGSPLWNGDSEEISIMGLLASGFGETVYRGKVSAVKMEPIRSIMKNHFQSAIDFANQTMQEPYFERCSVGVVKRLMPGCSWRTNDLRRSNQ